MVMEISSSIVGGLQSGPEVEARQVTALKLALEAEAKAAAALLRAALKAPEASAEGGAAGNGTRNPPHLGQNVDTRV